MQGDLQEEEKVQGGFDVSVCAGCALPMYRNNIKGTEEWMYWRLVVFVFGVEDEEVVVLWT